MIKRVHDLKIKEYEGEGSLCPLEIHSLSLPVAPEPASKGPQAQVSLTLRELPLASLHNTWRAGAGTLGQSTAHRAWLCENGSQAASLDARSIRLSSHDSLPTVGCRGCEVRPFTWLFVSPCHSQEMSTKLVFKASSQHVTYAKQKQLLLGQQTGKSYIIIIIIGAISVEHFPCSRLSIIHLYFHKCPVPQCILSLSHTAFLLYFLHSVYLFLS